MLCTDWIYILKEFIPYFMKNYIVKLNTYYYILHYIITVSNIDLILSQFLKCLTQVGCTWPDTCTENWLPTLWGRMYEKPKSLEPQPGWRALAHWLIGKAGTGIRCDGSKQGIGINLVFDYYTGIISYTYNMHGLTVIRIVL